MKRPLVTVALWYVGGILLAQAVALPLIPLLAGALGVTVAALIWNRARPRLLVPLLVLAGAANLTMRTAVISPLDLRRVAGENDALVTIQGKLRETPYHRVYERVEEESWRTLAQVEVTALRRGQGNWEPATGRVAVSTPGVLGAEFFSGAPIEISGLLCLPKGAAFAGAFDYRRYLSGLGIYHQLQVASTNDWHRFPPSSPPPVADQFLAWAEATLARGLPAEDEPLRLLWAMTLGWKTALTGEVSEPFMRSGTMHIFAISGLHIALIAGILVSLLRVLQMPRRVCGLVVIPLIWFYTGVTGWQASAIRSTVMMTVIIAGWALRRPSDLLNSLAAAGFIILVWEPQQIFQASFQLSFFVVLSLALFVPVLEKIRRRWLQPDPLLPDRLRPRWRRWLGVPVGWLTAGLATSLAAWLGSIPLIAYYFHLLTPVSLLANVVVVPLSSLALMSNLASLLTGGWFPPCAELFNHSAWFWMLLMIRVSEWAAWLPGACFYVSTPTLLTFVCYYALLVSAMAGWLVKPGVRTWVAAGLAALGVAWLIQWQQVRAATRLTVLPLSGGSAVYFDAPGRLDDGLIDCGNALAAESVLRPFLRAQGVNRLCRLFLTHGDVRYIGGTELVADSFSVWQIATSSVQFRSPTYRRIVQDLQTTPDRWLRVNRGDQIGPWTVLHPATRDRFLQADDSALVLLGAVHGTRILLLSDLGRPGQDALLERTPNLRADIVVAGLPAEAEPLNAALLDVIQPCAIVIADSEFPATRRATPKLRERLARRNIPVLYTRSAGAVRLSVRATGWELRPMNGMPVSVQNAN